MKKISPFLVLFVLALFVFALPVSAQLGNPATPVNAVSVAGTVTTNAVGAIELGNAKYIAVQLVTVSGAANTSNTVVTIDRSVDGSNWVSSYSTITLANTGTTTANCVSNYTAQGDAKWRFNVQNGALAAVTNTISIKVNKVQ